MDPQRINVLNVFLDRLKGQFGNHLRETILFGSRARGDAVPDSDYDCLVVLDSVSSDALEKIDDIMGELLYEHNVLFSIFPISEKRYQTQSSNPFLRNAKIEGLVL